MTLPVTVIQLVAIVQLVLYIVAALEYRKVGVWLQAYNIQLLILSM